MSMSSASDETTENLFVASGHPTGPTLMPTQLRDTTPAPLNSVGDGRPALEPIRPLAVFGLQIVESVPDRQREEMGSRDSGNTG